MKIRLHKDELEKLNTFVNTFQERVKPIFHCDAKSFVLGPGVGLDPQCHNFTLPIPTCWYLKMLKFALPLTQMLKCALPPMPTPNASQWNIGCVGSPTPNFHIGNVHFIFFVSISFAFGSQCKLSFQWNMGFRELSWFVSSLLSRGRWWRNTFQTIL